MVTPKSRAEDSRIPLSPQHKWPHPGNNTALTSSAPRLSTFVWGFMLVILVFAFCIPALPRAAFVADDYRYFSQLERQSISRTDLLAKYSVIENRWDHDWWLPEGTAVRFFRPLLLTSFAIDLKLWGRDPQGFVLTNIVLHCLAVFLAWLCLRLLVPGVPAFLAALAFGIHACHGENIWHVSARTDTLAALFAFSSLYLFVKRLQRPQALVSVGVWLSLLAALAAKEYNALLLLAGMGAQISLGAPKDRFGAPAKGEAAFWTGCIACLLLYLLARGWVFAHQPGVYSLPFPYFNLPGEPIFAPALAATLIQYISGLTSGTLIEQFAAEPAVFLARVSHGEIIFGAVMLALLMSAALWSAAARLFLTWFILTGLPVLFLHSSARFLYLPSLGYFGLMAIALDFLLKKQHWLTLLFLFSALALLPGLRLQRQFAMLPRLSSAQIEDKLLAALGQIAPHLKDAQAVFFLDFPFPWQQNQFLQSTAREGLNSDLPPLRVLTPSLPNRPETQAKVIDSNTIELTRPSGYLYEPNPFTDFAGREVQKGQQIEEAHYLATMADAKEGRAIKARITFRHPLRLVRVFRFKGKEQIVRVPFS